MGCFCRQAPLLWPVVPALPAASLSPGASVSLDLSLQEPGLGVPGAPMLAAVSAWLSARWLPGPAFAPDPALLDVDWPAPPMPPQAMSTLLSLVLARASLVRVLGLDPVRPADLARLARVIATLNLRADLLAALLAAEPRWDALVTPLAQADLVARAAAAGILALPAPNVRLAATLATGVPVAPWRPVLAKVKLLVPLVAIGQALSVDWTAPGAVDTLAALLRQLRALLLPPLTNLPMVLQLLARFDAAARLQLALGVNPRLVGPARVRAMVAARMTAAIRLMPPGLTLQAGVVAGLPPMQPNPSLILDPVVIRLALALRPPVLDRLRWQVPPFESLPLLTTGLPLASLLEALSKLGLDPIRHAPCGPVCDAAAAVQALAS